MNSTPWDHARRRAALYIGFAATGVALTIPGALLPLLLRRWSMSDARGGVLLFSLYAMGSLGSFSARGKMNHSVARGALLTVVGALCLAVAGRWSAYPAMALYGLGVSLSITSISLLLSQRFPSERRLEMTRLNLIWAVGAALGPWIALRSVRSVQSASSLSSIRPTRGLFVTHAALLHADHVFLGVAAFFAAAAVWAMWIEPSTSVPPSTSSTSASAHTSVHQTSLRQTTPETTRTRRIPWPLILLIFGATGVDAAAGGWLTSYAQRAGDSLGVTIGAATFLWLGALVSRIVHSTRWASRLPERWVLGTSTIAMSAALALLIAWPAGLVTMAAAALLGIATGPVYPLVIAAALRHRENSTIFAIAGLGASTLPLLTGALSTCAHSLRAGLTVPLLATIAMSILVAASGKAFTRKEEHIAEALLV